MFSYSRTMSNSEYGQHTVEISLATVIKFIIVIKKLIYIILNSIFTNKSSLLISAQYGSTMAQNLLGMSFLGSGCGIGIGGFGDSVLSKSGAFAD